MLLFIFNLFINQNQKHKNHQNQAENIMFRHTFLCSNRIHQRQSVNTLISSQQLFASFFASAVTISSKRLASTNNNNSNNKNSSLSAKPTTTFSKEVGGGSANNNNQQLDEWDLLDDDVDYWGHLFDEMQEGAFDAPDFVDPEEMKRFLDDGKEFGKFSNGGGASSSPSTTKP